MPNRAKATEPRTQLPIKDGGYFPVGAKPSSQARGRWASFSMSRRNPVELDLQETNEGG